VTHRSLIRELSSELDRAHAEFARLSREIERLENRHATLVEEDEETVESLARLYLPNLSPRSVSEGLVELREWMAGALKDQEKQRATLTAEVAQALALEREVEARRNELETEVAELNARLHEAREQVEAALGEDSEHARRVEEHEAVMEVRERLKRRGARLAAASTRERPHYESDRLFRYLRAREYGGPGYRGRGLTARIDRWLAERIDFATLERNYRILKTGPHEISHQVRELSERAAALEPIIDAQEESAARETGLLSLIEERGRLESLLTEAQADLDAARSARASIQAALDDVERHRGRDFDHALEAHRQFLERKSIQELRKLAESTPDPRDDGLVKKLADVRVQLDEVRAALKELRRKRSEASRRMSRLTDLQLGGVENVMNRSLTGAGIEAVHGIIDRFLSGDQSVEAVVDEIAGVGDDSMVVEVERPYFDAVYRELTAAFDDDLAQGGRVEETVWESDDGTEKEVVVRDGKGNVIRRRVTRRWIGEG